MSPRSWLAVSAGTLTGSALAITGSPQSRARPTATTSHLRAIWIFTKIPTRRSRAGQGGHLVYFAQTLNNRTITPVAPDTCYAVQMSGSPLSSGVLSQSRIGNCQ
jgi:hypothetical protein